AWADLSSGPPGSEEVVAPAEVRRLHAVADLADANAWRRRLRGALLNGDHKRVRQLAEETNVADLPPASVVFLVRALRQGRAPEERNVALLREGRRRHPSDFWLNFELATSLKKSQPPQLVEAVRYYTAAQALRPNSAVVLNNLGVALRAKGDM